MVRYRSWGRNGKVLGNVDSEHNFKDDHDLMKLQAGSQQNHPQRIVFGLPHNYGNQHQQRVGPDEAQLIAGQVLSSFTFIKNRPVPYHLACSFSFRRDSSPKIET